VQQRFTFYDLTRPSRSRTPIRDQIRSQILGYLRTQVRKRLGRWGTEEAVEDVVNDVAFELLDGGIALAMGEWGPEIDRVSKKVAFAYISQQRKQAERESSWEEGAGLAAASRTAAPVSGKQRMAEDLGWEYLATFQRAVRDLPDPYGRMFRLYYWNDLGPSTLDTDDSLPEPPKGKSGYTERQIARFHSGFTPGDVVNIVSGARSQIEAVMNEAVRAQRERSHLPGRKLSGVFD
jgi:hypothetical protein